MSQFRTRSKLLLTTALMTLLTVLVFPTGGALAADIAIDCATDDLQVAINAATNGDTIIIADASTCTGNFDVNRPLTIRAATAACPIPTILVRLGQSPPAACPLFTCPGFDRSQRARLIR